jgi:predicted nucleic acid-binding protein
MTAPAEPGVVDTNVLIFALDADSPHHKAARNLVEAARDGAMTLYVTSQILCEFYAVVTNARRVAKPRGSAEALDVIAGLLSFLHVLPVLAHAVTGWMSLLRRCPVTGGDVFDLQIVATMLASDVSRIYTFNNAEFEMFSELAVISP